MWVSDIAVAPFTYRGLLSLSPTTIITCTLGDKPRRNGRLILNEAPTKIFSLVASMTAHDNMLILRPATKAILCQYPAKPLYFIGDILTSAFIVFSGKVCFNLLFSLFHSPSILIIYSIPKLLGIWRWEVSQLWLIRFLLFCLTTQWLVISWHHISLELGVYDAYSTLSLDCQVLHQVYKKEQIYPA